MDELAVLEMRYRAIDDSILKAHVTMRWYHMLANGMAIFKQQNCPTNQKRLSNDNRFT